MHSICFMCTWMCNKCPVPLLFSIIVIHIACLVSLTAAEHQMGYEVAGGEKLHLNRLPDTSAFLEDISRLAADKHNGGGWEAAAGLFNWSQDLYVARAPGRMDVMGGIADYSGALVLQMPIQEACHAAVQLGQTTNTSGGQLRIVSLGADTHHRSPSLSIPMSALLMSATGTTAKVPDSVLYSKACGYFKSLGPSLSWAAYIAGCLLVLHCELGVDFSQSSVSILVCSNVPEGKGVSSSASVEVAVMRALVGALGLEVPGRDLALMCQRVENLVVGAPCGIMDQMSSALGEPGKLLALLCQPAEVQGCIPIPENLRVWGIDSGIRHSVGGSDYGSVRTGAFMGARISHIAAGLLGAAAGGADKSSTGGMSISEPGAAALKAALSCSKGHLVGISPSQFEALLVHLLPEDISGADFLSQYGPHLDTVTEVKPEQRYAVRQPSAHPIYEHHRVRLFQQLLLAPPTQEEQGQLLGELMMQSHASYSACQLGSPGTDRLVGLVQECIAERKAGGKHLVLYGAKITGGGSGGTVCVLGSDSPEAEAAVQAIITRYQQEAGLAHSPKLFSGSSMGAMAFGHLVVRAKP